MCVCVSGGIACQQWPGLLKTPSAPTMGVVMTMAGESSIQTMRQKASIVLSSGPIAAMYSFWLPSMLR
jgi:hypothetical protein